VRDDLTENTRTVNRTVEDIITEARAPAHTGTDTPARSPAGSGRRTEPGARAAGAAAR